VTAPPRGPRAPGGGRGVARGFGACGGPGQGAYRGCRGPPCPSPPPCPYLPPCPDPPGAPYPSGGWPYPPAGGSWPCWYGGGAYPPGSPAGGDQGCGPPPVPPFPVPLPPRGPLAVMFSPSRPRPCRRP